VEWADMFLEDLRCTKGKFTTLGLPGMRLVDEVFNIQFQTLEKKGLAERVIFDVMSIPFNCWDSARDNPVS
jgi:hypothetical protein